MGNDVFANGREISCKAADGKAICAFPDVCFTPPQTPATPPGVPIPYPNTGMASDATNGSKKVKISNKEVMLKNKSYFKKSTGDEAGSAPKKGVVTSKIQGKVYFNAWSMDVKFEGENVVRHLDLTTHNHGSVPANTMVWPYTDTQAVQLDKDPCTKEKEKEREKCAEVEKKVTAMNLPANRVNKVMREAYCEDSECREARKCMLHPETPDKEAGQPECCKSPPPKLTPHHVVPAHCFMPKGVRAAGGSDRYSGCENYSVEQAPCICVTGHDKSTGDHKLIHDIFDDLEDSNMVGGKAGTWSYDDAAYSGAGSVASVTGCDEECIRSQVNAYHQQDKPDKPNVQNNTKLRADSKGTRTPDDFTTVTAGALG